MQLLNLFISILTNYIALRVKTVLTNFTTQSILWLFIVICASNSVITIRFIITPADFCNT